MPAPESTVPNPGSGLSDYNPPDGGMSLDDLFPNPETALQQPNQPIQPVQPAPDYFLKASTGTVYRSQEDAVRGIEEKDRTIERLKSQLASMPQPQPTTPQAPDGTQYAKDLFKRLSAAAQAGDEVSYVQALTELQMNNLQPFAGLLNEVAREKAIRAMEPEAKDFRHFVGSAEYERTLEQFPLLKDAIKLAETDPYRSGQLPEFYKLVYRSYSAEHANDVARQIAQSTQPAPPPSRPTLTSSTPTLPPQGIPQRSMQMSRDQVLADRSARRDFLKRYESENSGSLSTSWSSVGL